MVFVLFVSARESFLVIKALNLDQPKRLYWRDYLQRCGQSVEKPQRKGSAQVQKEDWVLCHSWPEGARILWSGARGLCEDGRLVKALAFSKGLSRPKATSQGDGWRNKHRGLTLPSLSSPRAPRWLDTTRHRQQKRWLMYLYNSTCWNKG